MKTTLCLLFFATLACVASPPAAAAEKTITLTRPGQPAVLRAELTNGRLTVTGAEVREVQVRSSGTSKAKDTPRDDGLRVVASSSALNISERDNTIHLAQDPGAMFSGRADIDIVVPRDTTVIVRIAINGSAVIRDITGDIEVSNLNGPVQLENVSGGVAVDTMNGEVTARYAALPEGKTHAFSSMNGKIVLYVPATGKATFRLRAQNGTVATDLAETVFDTRAEGAPAMNVPRTDSSHNDNDIDDSGDATDEADTAEEPEATDQPPRPPRPPRVPTFPAFGGQVVTGLLNGGGVEVRATTMNGEIQIRQAK